VNLLFPEEEAPPPSPFFVVGEDETQPIFINVYVFLVKQGE
jgi:hypothetical protein